MSAPVARYQQYSVEPTTQIHQFPEGKPCRMYHASFDVRLTRSPGAGRTQLTTAPGPVPVAGLPGLAVGWNEGFEALP